MINKKVKWYERQLFTPEEQFDRMMEVERCKEVISRKIYYYNMDQRAEECRRCWVSFSKNRNTASFGSPWGFYVGMDAIEDYYIHRHLENRKAVQAEYQQAYPNENCTLGQGASILRTASTPVIYLAEDGETAQGMWFISGEETLGHADGSADGYHIFGRAGVDLIKENDDWKIWHWAEVYDMVCLAGEKVSSQPLYPRPEQTPFRQEFEAGNPTIKMITHFPSTHSADGWPSFPCAHASYGPDNSYAPEGHPGLRDDCMDVNWEARMASYEAWGY